ncbi:MAG: alpha/beta hydrolase domain-containing protein [Dehalococcoidia bacterium]
MAVTRIDIQSRQPFAQGQPFGSVGAFEQLEGVVHFAVDPNDPANSTITDLKLAPRNAQGLVEFSSDFRVVRPVDPSKGSHRLVFDILNRGRGPILRNMNYAPDLPPNQPLDPGDGLLMRQGYTVAWCGWQYDAPDVPGVLRLHGPEAQNPDGSPITGQLTVTFQPNSAIQQQFLSDRNHRPYPSNNLEDWDAYMTVQDHEDGPEQIVPREQWTFARVENGQRVPDAEYVTLEGGFEPGKVYQVIYSTTGAPIVGLGLVATRDFGSFLRYGTEQQGNPCAGDLEHAYSFGSSQSGRFLRDFLYHDLTKDEADRPVFDGLIPHVAGAKHGEFNQRFAQPSTQASRTYNNRFPFSDLDQTDPETGKTDGILTLARQRGFVPKVINTYTSSEYWAGGGAMMHIDLTGSRDLEIPSEVRNFHFGGCQHSLGETQLQDRNPGNGTHGQNPFNCIDYRPLLRGALVSLDRWVTTGQEPPASQYPKLSNGTAVTPETVTAVFSTFPDTNTANPFRRFYRMDFGPEVGISANVPPQRGSNYPILVPAVDQDGNETSGIRMPQVLVPLASYTGWSLRHADIGGEGQILASGGATGGTLLGSTIPFPATREDREASGDPRLSIEERYTSKDVYLEQIRQAAQGLIDQNYLLVEDLDRILSQASAHYDELRSRVRQPQAADN